MLGSFNRHLTRGLAQMNIGRQAQLEIDAQRIKLAAMRVPAQVRPVVEESFVAGFRVVMLISAGLGLASAAIALLMIRDER